MKKVQVKKYIDEDGSVYFCKRGTTIIHRENDKPAFINKDGSKFWLFNGLLHRDNDKPAIEWFNGSKEWFVHGESRHRIELGKDVTEEWLNIRHSRNIHIKNELKGGFSWITKM
jgi:hypothetical protein